MILIYLKTKSGRSIIVLNHVVGIEYDEKTGELTFVGENTARPIYLDKETPERDVWAAIDRAFAPLWEARSMLVPAFRADLDVTPYQTKEVSF